MRTQDVLALAEQSRAYHQSNVSLVFLVDFAKRVAAAECERICPAIKAEPVQEPVQHYASIPGTNVRVRLQAEPVEGEKT